MNKLISTKTSLLPHLKGLNKDDIKVFIQTKISYELYTQLLGTGNDIELVDWLYDLVNPILISEPIEDIVIYKGDKFKSTITGEIIEINYYTDIELVRNAIIKSKLVKVK